MNTETALRKLRQNIFNYDGTEKEAQADRVLLYLKTRLLRERKPKITGPYSGLTNTELAKSGTCEPDWF